jgi:predicted RNA binding protein YcfA (HicA-like mRNA interferase family)
LSSWPSTRARRVLSALLRIGWSVKRVRGSHRVPERRASAPVEVEEHAPLPEAAMAFARRSWEGDIDGIPIEREARDAGGGG